MSTQRSPTLDISASLSSSETDQWRDRIVTEVKPCSQWAPSGVSFAHSYMRRARSDSNRSAPKKVKNCSLQIYNSEFL